MGESINGEVLYRAGLRSPYDHFVWSCSYLARHNFSAIPTILIHVVVVNLTSFMLPIISCLPKYFILQPSPQSLTMFSCLSAFFSPGCVSSNCHQVIITVTTTQTWNCIICSHLLFLIPNRVRLRRPSVPILWHFWDSPQRRRGSRGTVQVQVSYVLDDTELKYIIQQICIKL